MHPHEGQDLREPLFPVRCRRCLIDLLPLTVCILAVVGILIWTLTGCTSLADHRTTHEEVRVACGTAARTYGLAIERTRSGDMAPTTFRAIDDSYQGVIGTCRRVLVGGAEAVPGDLARVETWTAGTEAATP